MKQRFFSSVWCMRIVLVLVCLLAPQGAWAKALGSNTSIKSDVNKLFFGVYDSDCTVTIEEGVTVTIANTISLYGSNAKLINYGTIVCNALDFPSSSATFVNYGTFNGTINCNSGGTVANHGTLNGYVTIGSGCTYYSTGTHSGGGNIFETKQCNHTSLTEIGSVPSATCTSAAGTKYCCNTCYYIQFKANQGSTALGHAFDAEHTHAAVAANCFSNGNIAYQECTRCHEIFDMEGNTVKNVSIPITHAPGEDGYCTICQSGEATIDIGNSPTNAAPYNNGENHNNLNATTISLYLGSEINMSGQIKEIAYHVAASGTFETKEVKIYMAMTDMIDFHYNHEAEGNSSDICKTDKRIPPVNPEDFTLVYSGNPVLGTSKGWEKLTLTRLFEYDKNKNLLVAVCTKAEKPNTTLNYTCINVGDNQYLGPDRFNSNKGPYRAWWAPDVNGTDERCSELSEAILPEVDTNGRFFYLPNIRLGFLSQTAKLQKVTAENFSVFGLTEGHIGYYAINNAVQLAALRGLVNTAETGGDTTTYPNTNANAVLIADIDMKLVCHEANAQAEVDAVSWEPIGSESPYLGTFDGNGYSLKNLYVNTAHPNAGFIGTLGMIGTTKACVKDLNVSGSVTSRGHHVGIIAANVQNAQIMKCSSAGAVSSTSANSAFLGGAFGELQNTDVSDVYAAATVTKVDNATDYGAFVGKTDNVAFANCYFDQQKAGCGFQVGSSGAITPEGCVGKNTAEFASGEVCYLLNGSRSVGTAESPLLWYQNLRANGDATPVLKKNGNFNTVYFGYIDCTIPSYSNSPMAITEPGHNVCRVEAKETSCAVAGNYEHWTCTKCNNLYTDASAETKTTVAAVTIASLPHSYDAFEKCTVCGHELPEISAVTFADGSAYNRASAATVGSLTYSRPVPDAQVGKWQALYVPFQMQYSDWSEDFDVATILNFHEYADETGTIVKTELEARYVKSGYQLKANTPYLIRPKRAGEKSFTFQNTTLAKAENASIVCQSMERRYTFTGTYQPMSNFAANGYLCMTDGSLMQATDNTATLDAQRWYLNIENLGSQMVGGSSVQNAGAIRIRIIGDDEFEEETGLGSINNEQITINNDPGVIYNLQGQRLSAPQRGMNIINGKKVMVK